MRAPLLALTLVASLALIAALAGLALTRRGGGTVAGMLPDNTMLAMHLPHPAGLAAGLEQLASEDALRGGAWQVAAHLLTQQAARLGLEVSASGADAQMLLDRDLILGILPAGQEGANPSWVLAARAGTAPEAAWSRLRLILQEAAAASGAVATIRSHRGHEYLRLRGPRAGSPLCVALWRDRIIATDSADSMRRCLDAADGRGRSLEDTPAFQKTLKQLGRGSSAQALIWASSEGLEWLGGRVPASAPGSTGLARSLRLLGLGSATGAGLSLEVRGGLAEERSFVMLPREGGGLLWTLFTGAPRMREEQVGASSLAWQLTASVARIDALHDRLPDILALAGGAPRKELRERLDGMEAFLGGDPLADLAPALGTKVNLSFGARRNADVGADHGMPWVLTWAVRRREPIARALTRLDGLVRATGGSRAQEVAAGLSITSFDLPSWRPMNPAWCLTARDLILGSSPELVVAAAASSRSEGGNRVRGDSGRGNHSRESRSGLMSDAHFHLQGDTDRLLALLSPEPADDSALGDLTAAMRARAMEAGMPALRAAGRMTSEGLLMEWRAPLPVALIGLWRALRGGSPEAMQAPAVSGAAESRQEPQPACAGWQIK